MNLNPFNEYEPEKFWWGILVSTMLAQFVINDVTTATYVIDTDSGSQTMIERALVVESNLVSRRSLARDLQNNDIASSVVEAESVPDGLAQLERSPFGVCLLGPELQAKTIKNFLSQGRFRSAAPHCAFVRVKKADSTEPEIDKLVDITIDVGYEARTFKQAISEAAEQRLPRSTLLQSQTPSCSEEAPLSDTLATLAIEMRGLARALTTGKLTLDRNGEPSDATLYALRKTLERAFPERNQHGDLPVDVKAFLNLTLDFMKARVTGKEGEIIQQIRRLV